MRKKKKLQFVADMPLQQYAILSQALSDAVSYRDPPVTCTACPSLDELCGACVTALKTTSAYLALFDVFRLERHPSWIARHPSW